MKREHRFFGENQTKQAVDFIITNRLVVGDYRIVFDTATLCIYIEWDDGIEEVEWNN